MEMDRKHRYAPTVVAKVVDKGLVYAPVESTHVYPIGSAPPNSPIRKDMCQLELRSSIGSNWYGIERGYINAELRMVVVGTPSRDEVRMKWAVVPKRLQDGRK